MFSLPTVIGIILVYFLFLFFVAQFFERPSGVGTKMANSPSVYALSLAVYCTMWTYYGSVGLAGKSGLLYLTIYLGPTLGIVMWWYTLRKLVRMKKSYHITSLTDFLVARYSKSAALGAATTLFVVIGIIPYIALQLKAITSTVALMTANGGSSQDSMNFVGPLVVVLMIVFTVMFGLRRLDPTERHPGMIMTLSVESIIKLVGFMAAGFFVVFYLYSGPMDIYHRVQDVYTQSTPFFGNSGAKEVGTWVTLLILASSAILFLPRQFHVAVVENANEKHILRALWMFPLYMVLINLFVLPIAVGGMALNEGALQMDTLVLSLPIQKGVAWLSILVFIGGISAGAGMIAVETMTLSTMIVNSLFLPVIHKVDALAPLKKKLLLQKWFAAALCIVLGYGYTLAVGDSYALVAMGLISFAAVFQFAPAIIGGLFWKRGNLGGAALGIGLGFAMWFYTLFLPAFMKSGFISDDLLIHGLFGLSWLRPESLFGLGGLHPHTHSMIWTMFFNIGGYLVGSVLYQASEEENQTAHDVVDILHGKKVVSNYGKQKQVSLATKGKKIVAFLKEYFDDDSAETIMNQCLVSCEIDQKRSTIAITQLAELHSDLEKRMAGVLGTAVAHSALKDAALIAEEEKTSLSQVYGEMLADLHISPNELVERIDFYKERQELLSQQALDLEKKLEERDRENLEKTKEVFEANSQLKKEINEKVKAQSEREKLNQQLVETARSAGMAEIATSVLHNVGNVLNSVNVSAEMAATRLGASKVDRLKQLADLIVENGDCLATFFTENEKGLKVPAYLEKLADNLVNENHKVKSEIFELMRNIDHIKSIVSMQQSYARVSDICEDIRVQDLIADAIRINQSSLDRHGIRVESDCDDAPEFSLEKNKILQVLVNLVGNAKNALENKENDKLIQISFRVGNDGFFEIKVEDNGVGIPPDNLEKIFQHGFTTRKDGHGFGLHHGANTAKESGGALLVESNGEGKGSRFTLRWPTGEAIGQLAA